MRYTRREIIKLLNLGLLFQLTSSCKEDEPTLPELRFAVASDGHYGEENTPSDQYYSDLITALTNKHKVTPLNFLVVNGDLVHRNSTQRLPKVKSYLDQLPFPYYVTRGNHDQVTESEWQALWGYQTNHVVKLAEATLILLDTSNENGSYECGNHNWLETVLQNSDPNLPVFIFMHIPYIRNLSGTDICLDIHSVVSKYSNIRGIFHGHDHNQDSTYKFNHLTYLFDGHFGSTWGVPYRGFRLVERQNPNEFLTYQQDYVNDLRLRETIF